jgi:hypothetical protein
LGARAVLGASLEALGETGVLGVAEERH